MALVKFLRGMIQRDLVRAGGRNGVSLYTLRNCFSLILRFALQHNGVLWCRTVLPTRRSAACCSWGVTGLQVSESPIHVEASVTAVVQLAFFQIVPKASCWYIAIELMRLHSRSIDLTSLVSCLYVARVAVPSSTSSLCCTRLIKSRASLTEGVNYVTADYFMDSTCYDSILN